MSEKRLSIPRQQNRSLAEFLDTTQPHPTTTISAPAEHFIKPILRFARYTAVRFIVLFLTVVAGLYFTLLATELGGKLDEVRRADIAFAAAMAVGANPANRELTQAERLRLAREMEAAMLAAQDLDRHVMVRMAEWLPRGMTLQLGQSRGIRTLYPRPPAEQRVVKYLILERIPNTLLLMGVTNLVFFFTSVWLGLILSRRYGRWLDKLFVVLSPLSAAPSWFYGLFLVAIFAGMLGWLPFGGLYPPVPPDSRWLYGLEMARHMVLPFTAVFLSVFFYSVYVWRTFFLIYSSEDYVDMAVAKGLPQRLIARRYILRPTLPTILTSVVYMIIGVWSGSIILERLFGWPGLGDLYYRAIVGSDTAVIVGLTIVYAYFLAVTIFILDIAYAFIDPRVRLGKGPGQEQQKSKAAAAAGPRRFWPFIKKDEGQRTNDEGRTTNDERLRTNVGRSSLRRSQGRLLVIGHFGHRSSRSAVTYLRTLPWRFLRGLGHSLKRAPQSAWRLMKGGAELRRHPSALGGMVIILFLIAMSVYAVTAIPYQEAVRLWRASESDWHEAPRNARPVWFNYFRRHKMPETVVMDSRLGEGEKTVAMQPGLKEITLTYTFDFPYDGFPQEPLVYLYPLYDTKVPHVIMTWLTPDGREIQLGQLIPRYAQRHRFSEDTRLMRRLRGLTAQQGLFADPDAAEMVALRGEYQFQIVALMFEDEAEFDAKFILHGQVYGLAGTDHRRRDLSIALLWGTPLALGFGLLAAFSTAFLTMALAAAGAWWGGLADDLIQRIAEVNLVLPVFPILAMFTSFFTLRIWEVLGLAILFSVFGSAIKSYRALFLQVKESPYIEAAQAYGASNSRIILHYLLPRILPVLIPQIMILVPTYVFLEAALAFFGLSDLYLPTWGKVINEAHMGSALLNGQYYWILQPAILLMLTAFAFAMLGFALDRIFNPRLREV